MKKNLWLLLAMLTAVIVVVSACAPAPPAEEPADKEAPAEEAAATEEPAAEAPAAEEAPAEEPAAAATEEAAGGESMASTGEGGYLDRALAGEFAGTTVTMMGPFTDEDEVKFNNAIADFEEKTGIDIQYTGTKEFEATISVRVDAGDAPDIVDFPQPGLAANFAKTGDIVDVLSFMDVDTLRQRYDDSWLDMALVNGPDGSPMMTGVWHRFNGKSLVWYPKDDFDAAGYEVPETWDDMLELTQMIADDGDTAWCVGIESGAATGWPATDWMEEVMLRTTSLENYDAWVVGDLPFSSPEVKNAAEQIANIWFNDEYVLGGRAGIVSTFFGDAPNGMFEDPPRCWLHKQGNFITSFFPAGAEAGVDYDFFYLPPIDEQYGKPFLVAGDLMAAFSDRDETKAVMEFFSTGESVKGWLQAGGALSPHKDAQLDWYGDDVERGIAQLVQEATAFRFDGSDLMPGEVGAGSFWKGMTDWVSGSADLDTALQEIDASWPDSARTGASPTLKDLGVAPAEGGAAASDEAMAEATEEPAADATDESMASTGEGGYLDRALAGEFAGTTVTMMGPFTDEDEVKFNNAIADFEEKTGIDIQYTGTKEFEATISVRVDAGDAPNIVDFPQPGLAANFASTGDIVDVLSFMDMDTLKQRYDDSWLDMATVEGQDGPMMAGVWHRFNGKSLVWYPKAQFDAAGYEVPETWDDMLELTQMIADDGDTAWCVGIESGAATGWPATDWMEEVMLRTTSLENYDAWVVGDLPFSSPEVKNAAEQIANIWFNDEYVLGGRAGIVSTFFGDAPNGMFEDPPRCWLHKQGNFITSFFPAGAEAGVDYDFFYLPPIDEQYGKPFLVAGDLMAAFSDSDETKAVMEFFSTGESVKGWLQAGGALSPHKDAQLDWYGDDVERGIAQLVQEATAFRFDGSDLMPGEVGAGSFWKGMTDWVSGSTDLDTALQEIDASWPKN